MGIKLFYNALAFPGRVFRVLTVKAPPATAGLFLCLTSARSKILFCDNIINVAQLEKSVGKHFLELFSN